MNGCSNAFFKKLKNEKILESDNEKYTNIKQLLEHYKDSKLLTLKWIIYDDNELIERDMSKSVYEVFTRKSEYQHKLYKSIFNKHLIKNFNTDAGHKLIESNKYYINCINKNEKHDIWLYNYQLLENEPYIRHFKTYSLKEYLYSKYRRTFFDESKRFINYNLLSRYYFNINKLNNQKQKYIEEYKKKNNIIKTFYFFHTNVYTKLYNILNSKICLLLNYCNNQLKANFEYFTFNIFIEMIQNFDYIVFL